jgi:hypothetical protein
MINKADEKVQQGQQQKERKKNACICMFVYLIVRVLQGGAVNLEDGRDVMARGNGHQVKYLCTFPAVRRGKYSE